MKSPLLHGPIIIQSRLYGLQSYPPPQGGTGYAKMEMHEVTPPPRSHYNSVTFVRAPELSASSRWHWLRTGYAKMEMHEVTPPPRSHYNSVTFVRAPELSASSRWHWLRQNGNA